MAVNQIRPYQAARAGESARLKEECQRRSARSIRYEPSDPTPGAWRRAQSSRGGHHRRRHENSRVNPPVDARNVPTARSSQRAASWRAYGAKTAKHGSPNHDPGAGVTGSRLPAGEERPARFVQRREVMFSVRHVACENLAYAWRIASGHGPDCVATALEQLVLRHEILSIRFDISGTRVVAIAHDAQAPRIRTVDLRSQSPDSQRATIAAFVARGVRKAIDVTKAPLARVCLIRCGGDQDVLVLVVPHIMWDLRSSHIFAEELALLLVGDHASLPAAPLALSDYAAHESRQPDDVALRYWRRELAGYRKQLALRGGARWQAMDHHTRIRSFRVADKDASRRLAHIARGQRTTLPIATLAAYVTYLVVARGDTDVTVAVADANRSRPELRNVLGYLVSMSLVRVRVDERRPFLDVVAEAHRARVEAAQHEMAAEWQAGDPAALEPEEVPLCDVVFNFVPAARAPHGQPRGPAARSINALPRIRPRTDRSVPDSLIPVGRRSGLRDL